MLTFKNTLFSQCQLLYLWQKRINTVGRISEINKTKDKGTRITGWLASRFPTQDSSWTVRVPRILWLTRVCWALYLGPLGCRTLPAFPSLRENKVNPGPSPVAHASSSYLELGNQGTLRSWFWLFLLFIWKVEHVHPTQRLAASYLRELVFLLVTSGPIYLSLTNSSNS